MNQLKDDIDRYFEATLSMEEERDLMRRLMEMETRDPAADEALAVMLASRLIPAAPALRRKRPVISRIAGVAASIAVLIAIGILYFPRSQETETFAYVSGKKIHDRTEIDNIVTSQLKDMGESSEFFAQTVTCDLEDIREALISDEL